MGVFYCTPMYSMHTYPLDNIIKVYHDEKGEPMALEDDCKNQFRIVHKWELERYTWKGNPIELHTKVATIAQFRDT